MNNNTEIKGRGFDLLPINKIDISDKTEKNGGEKPKPTKLNLINYTFIMKKVLEKGMMASLGFESPVELIVLIIVIVLLIILGVLL